MQLHEQIEETRKQTSFSDTQVLSETVVPVPVETSQNTITGADSLTDLLATAEQENATRRKWMPVSLLWLVAQLAILISAPNGPFAGPSYAFSMFLAVFVGIRF